MARLIPELITDPVVAYRLGPGEPGVANPVPASRSVYTVVGQESRNRARLRAEAQVAGRQVLLVKTEYKVRRVGSFIVPVGGLTTVISRERPRADRPSSPLEQAKPEAGGANEPDGARDRGETRRVAELRAERTRLEREQREVARLAQDGGPYEVARAEQRFQEIERRLRQIDEGLRELGVVAGATVGRPDVVFGVNGFAAGMGVVGQLLDVLV